MNRVVNLTICDKNTEYVGSFLRALVKRAMVGLLGGMAVVIRAELRYGGDGTMVLSLVFGLWSNQGNDAYVEQCMRQL